MPIAVKRNDEEAQNQSAYFKWLAFAHPSVDKVTFAIPNGGKRPISTAVKLKAQGVKAGVLDVYMSEPNAHHPGLYIEFKSHGKKLTKSQAAFAASVRLRGYAVSVCYSYMDAINVTIKYLSERLGGNNGKL